MLPTTPPDEEALAAAKKEAEQAAAAAEAKEEAKKQAADDGVPLDPRLSPTEASDILKLKKDITMAFFYEKLTDRIYPMNCRKQLIDEYNVCHFSNAGLKLTEILQTTETTNLSMRVLRWWKGHLHGTRAFRSLCDL